MKKQNDKESARDMTNFKPSNFQGWQGWGLPRRKGENATPLLQIDTEPRISRSRGEDHTTLLICTSGLLRYYAA
jgi:hypothetical protein